MVVEKGEEFKEFEERSQEPESRSQEVSVGEHYEQDEGEGPRPKKNLTQRRKG
jgi:hypothetical protein